MVLPCRQAFTNAGHWGREGIRAEKPGLSYNGLKLRSPRSLSLTSAARLGALPIIPASWNAQTSLLNRRRIRVNGFNELATTSEFQPGTLPFQFSVATRL